MGQSLQLPYTLSMWSQYHIPFCAVFFSGPRTLVFLLAQCHRFTGDMDSAPPNPAFILEVRLLSQERGDMV